MTISIEAANDLLKKGYPEKKEDLNGFLEVLYLLPYGHLLKRLWERPGFDGDRYRVHGPKVLDKMNNLLSEEREKFLERQGDDGSKDILGQMTLGIHKLFPRFDERVKLFFRLAALYHDIGKYIINERHPTIGWYTMEYLSRSAKELGEPLGDKEQLCELLGSQENLELLLLIVRDHDEFGVLCTGEASYPILLNAATSLGTSDQDQKKIISAIMWVNLADIAGTLKSGVTYDILKKIFDDWDWYLQAIEARKANRQSLEEYVIKESGTEDMVVERISRLLLEASREYTQRYTELSRPYQDKPLVNQLVRNQIRRVYPTHNPRKEFIFQLTLVCKLDYGKRFFAKLIEYCEGPQEKNANDIAMASEKREDVDKLIYAVLAILRRITGTYEAMIKSDGGLGN